MKRQFMKSLMAFCTGVMTLVAASSLVVSCYDDSALREDLEDLEGEIDGLDARLKALEALKDVTAGVDALYTLQFQVSDSNELQYSFDGKEWKGTGVYLAEECDCEPVPPCDHECPPCQYVPCDHECPEVSVVDNGETVTIKIGDAEFTIEKPQEIVFEIRAGKVYFESESTMKVSIKSSGIEDISVMSAPKGWYAEINSEGMVEITAPSYEDCQDDYGYDENDEYYVIPAKCAASGYVKVHACSVDGKCMVGKLPVEVASQPLIVKAFGETAYFRLAGTSSWWNATFYYGASEKDNLAADTADLLKRMNDGDWSISDDYLSNYGELTDIEVSIAELLGEEPQVGKEYVIWAAVENSNAMPYDLEDLVLTYYSPLSVTITENEAAKTAYNVEVTVEVLGADSYVAVAMPESQLQWTSVDEIKEQMAMAMAEGMYYGKLYNESYTGSALDIAAGTSYSMTGNYSPDSDVYVFILPIDGRSAEDYTVDDVVYEQFATAPLAAGGSIDLTAKPITSYMGEVFDYEIYEYVMKEIVLDPYTELGVEVTPSATADWTAFYFAWLDEATYADYGSYEEDLVDYLLENTYGMTTTEVKGWPLYLTETVSPNTTMHFVAFVVDAAGKYGKIAHAELTSAELKSAEILWVEPYTTNLVDGSLNNVQTLEFTPVTEGEAASYKYVWQMTTYYNPYEGKDDAQMAEEIFFSSSAKTVTADELVDGKIVIEGHRYGEPYYFAVLPLDADGAPGKSAAILEYSCNFALDNVITEGADYTATEPEIVINLPDWSELYTGGDYGDGSYYGWEDQTAWGYGYRFYYEFNYSVAPKEGTTVSAILVDAGNWTIGTDACTKVSQVLQESFGTPFTTTVAEDALYTYFGSYSDEPAPEVYLMVVWSDAAGNYYYKEYALQSELQKYADKLAESLGLGEVELPTPDGKQLTFVWEEMMGAPAVLDFGVTTSGKLAVAYDMLAVYGEDAGIPEEMRWMQYNAWDYEVAANDATSGVIKISSVDHFGDVQTTEGTYSEWDGETCLVTMEMLMLENVTMTVAAAPIPVYIEQGGMIM